jgi:hypothetical protein
MADQNPPQKPFRPWWRDYRKAAACLIGAGGAVLVLTTHDNAGPAALIVALGAIAAFRVARSSWQLGHKRQRGHRVEMSARSKLKRILPFGWSVDKTTPLVPGAGDVDVLIRTGRYGFVVEIKSWETYDERIQAAAAQARKQLQAARQREGRTKWQAVVWLPLGKKAQKREDRDLIVVLGPASWLLWVLHLVLFKFF